MRIHDVLGVELSATRRLNELLGSPLDDLRKQMALDGVGAFQSPVQKMIEQMRRDEAMRRTMFLDADRLSVVREASRIWAEQDRWREALALPSIVEEARRAAEFTQGLRLPDVLSAYRSPIEEMTLKLARTQAVELWRDPAYLTAFNQTSALCDLYAESARVTRAICEANRAMVLEPIGIGSLAEYRGLLDAAGLTLPRWPRVRLLTKAEKRRRFRARLNDNVEPPHVKRAKSLVHRYELTLRDLLDTAMAEAYGEEWPDERLPLCDCRDLLGKWKRRGGAVLDHADYAHYARIVSHPEHFAAIFHGGFEDADEASELLSKAGRLERFRSDPIQSGIPKSGAF